MAAHQAPPSLGFSRQEHWSGLPFPSPMHEREKGKWSRSVVSDVRWIIKKAREFQKNICFCFIDDTKALDCEDHNKWKFWKRWEYQTAWPAFWEICMQVKKQQLELDMEQQTCSKSGKEYIKAVYCHPGYLTYLQSTSEKVMATHSSTLAWRIPWTEEPRRLQSMGLLRVGHDWVTSLSLFTFMHWRRKWQPTPVFLPGESQGRGSLLGYRLWGCTESDTTEAT